MLCFIIYVKCMLQLKRKRKSMRANGDDGKEGKIH